MKGRLQLFAAVLLGPGALAAAHVIALSGPALTAEEGLLLGNGDLSCSVFQTADEVVFRFGKGDVWDRRLDLDGLPPPTTLKEFRRGLIDEGWKCRVDGAHLTATKGTKNEKRMREICGGWSRALGRRPYPCPKPTGDLRLHYPADLPGPPAVAQRVLVEEGRYELEMKWRNGVTLAVEAVVAPVQNEFSLKWEVTGWNEATKAGREKPPVYFDLLRRADPDFMAWNAEFYRRHNQSHAAPGKEKAQPLPPPRAVFTNGLLGVEQAFWPDALFPAGFRCRVLLFAPKELGPAYIPPTRLWPSLALVRFRPRPSVCAGELQVAVRTSRDASLDASPPAPHAAQRAVAAQAAAAYWALSGLSVPGDPFLEWLWYATYHARRCVLRGGTVPPGLFLPSTIGDYSPWHGDYHSNYNLQSIYWGDLTANRLDQAAAYFDTIDFFRPIGRKIARDYYGCRGVFIQLEGFPLLAADDYNGTVALGRMAYMTGWAMTRYREYWQYTRDRNWLRQRGYPFIRECALFYLDFLLKAPHPDLPPQLADGKYHAYPSIDSETGLSGNPLDLTDQPDTMRFVRHCLFAAIEAAEALDTDADLREQWRDRLFNLAGRPVATAPDQPFTVLAPPEHGDARPYVAPKRWEGAPPAPPRWNNAWYYGMQTRHRLGRLRNNSYDPASCWPEYRAAIERWTHPNGLVWGMAIADLGRVGGWTESLSCMAPYQEMMLQSWDGAIRLFPWWPRRIDAAFRSWRAQGAFLVSAEWKGARIGRVEIVSQKGEPCLVHGDWRVTDAAGAAVPTDRDAFGRLRFQTVPGGVYRLTVQ